MIANVSARRSGRRHHDHLIFVLDRMVLLLHEVRRIPSADLLFERERI